MQVELSWAKRRWIAYALLGALSAAWCCFPKDHPVRTAADAICATARAWETDSPEVEQLRMMCEAQKPLEKLEGQLNVCLQSVQVSEGKATE